jgi:hypothetical protein
MKEKLVSLGGKIKSFVKGIAVYVVIVACSIAAYFIGVFHNKMTTKPVEAKIEVIKVKKSQVNLAIDENNHLIIINKESGNYTIYQDSIGKTIFKLYAKNVWGQHNADIK